MRPRVRPGVQPAADGPDATADPRPERTGRALWRGVVAGLSYGLLALALLAVAVTVVIPAVAGATPVTVASGSMEPALPVGSLTVVRPVDPSDVRLGDVVTFLPDPDDTTSVTHRVVAITNHADGTRTFTTQGDANAVADAPVGEHQLRGRVWYTIPHLGYVNNAVHGEHRSLLVHTVAGGLLVWAGSLWVGAYRDRRVTRGRARPAAAGTAT